MIQLLCSFSKLLEDLEASKQELGIRGYGLAETTLEEVFLAVNSKGKGAADPSLEDVGLHHTAIAVEGDEPEAPLLGGENGLARHSGSFDGDLRRPTRLTVSNTSTPSPPASSTHVCMSSRDIEDR